MDLIELETTFNKIIQLLKPLTQLSNKVYNYIIFLLLKPSFSFFLLYFTLFYFLLLYFILQTSLLVEEIEKLNISLNLAKNSVFEPKLIPQINEIIDIIHETEDKVNNILINYY